MLSTRAVRVWQPMSPRPILPPSLLQLRRLWIFQNDPRAASMRFEVEGEHQRRMTRLYSLAAMTVR